MDIEPIFKEYLFAEDRIIRELKLVNFLRLFKFEKLVFSKLMNIFKGYKFSIFNILNFAKNQDFKDFYFRELINNQIEKCEDNLLLFENYLKKINSIDILYKRHYYRKLFFYIQNNKEDLYKLYNMLKSFKNYIYTVDIKNLKHLDYKDLNQGDIVLSLKSENLIKHNFEYKLIKSFTKSNIEHANIFYESAKVGSENKYFFIDIKNFSKNTSIFQKIISENLFSKSEEEYSNENKGVIMRAKFDLSKKEKKEILKYSKSMIGVKYGLLKAFNIIPLTKLIFPITRNYRNFSSRSIYCSEFVAKAYESAGIFIGNKEDNSTVTPIDILNSPELKVVGFIDGESKK